MWLLEYGIKIVEIIIYFLILHLVLIVFVELKLLYVKVTDGPTPKEILYVVLSYSIIYILLKYIILLN